MPSIRYIDVCLRDFSRLEPEEQEIWLRGVLLAAGFDVTRPISRQNSYNTNTVTFTQETDPDFSVAIASIDSVLSSFETGIIERPKRHIKHENQP